MGAEILNIIPGRVSVSVDPRLGYDYDGILSKVILPFPILPTYLTI